MKRLNERELTPVAGERTLQSIRFVLARMTDVVWQASPSGGVTSVTPCRPNAHAGQGDLDESEAAAIDHGWRRAVRCSERFNAVYHAYAHGSSPRTFQLQAVPVLDGQDEVLYWAGTVVEVDTFINAGSEFVYEAAAVLSSSLNNATVINRLAQTAIEYFCDLCAVHTFDSDGSKRLEGFATRRPEFPIPLEAFEPTLDEAIASRQPLLLSAAAGEPYGTTGRELLSIAEARSAIVAPLLVGNSCVGTAIFMESERPASFGSADAGVAVVVARQLAMALENIRAFERERRISDRFRCLTRISECLDTTIDSAKTLQLVLDTLLESFADCAVAAQLCDERLRVVATAGTNAPLRETAEREIVALLRQRQSFSSASTVSSTLRIRPGLLFKDRQPRSWMVAPLYVGDGVFGAILCCSNSHSFDTGELELLEEIGRRVSLALEHAQSFARERRLVQTLQQATLPARLAVVEGATLSAVYRPAELELQVGGDWYDAFDLDDRRVLLTVGDVTGHGLEASIVMGKLRHVINVVAMYEPDPVRILDAAERIVLRRFPNSVATAFVAIFDSRYKTLTYANAGHPYPILRSADGSLRELRADGLPIGVRHAVPSARSQTERVDDAALLAFYTDGLVEITRDMTAGERRLREALSTDAVLYTENPAEFVEKFCVRSQSRDDIAVLLLNFVRCRHWAFDSSDWEAARAARHEFAANLRETGVPEDDIPAAELVFGELTANVAQHTGSRVEAALEWRDGTALLHIIDRGQGYTGKCGEADLLTEHGRGLWLIQRLGARLHFECLTGFGTHVRAQLPVGPAAFAG